ncbi:MAG TPA: DUF58 domain-containing protein [Acidimicrobiales bacterium]|nr:DUF58 domain-containing protein [Acidimicrobiales bacterium]
MIGTVTTGTGGVVRREGRLRQLELLVTRKLDGLLQGDYQGLVPAGGTEPGEGRLYAPGDDVRRMDWNLTARSNAAHVRNTVADRELETWIVFDASASLDFGTTDQEKRDLALSAAGAFAFLTARNGNRIGAVLFGADGSEVVPPRGGREAALALLHAIEARPRAMPRGDQGSFGLADALRRARLVAHRRGLVVVVSDLLDDGPWDRELRALALRHQVVVCSVGDPRERELPRVGLLTLVDPETGRTVDVQTSDEKLRRRFAAAAAEQDRRHAEVVRRSGARHLVLSTDRDWLRDVVRHVVSTRRRR